MRAFRPSRFALVEEHSEDFEQDKTKQLNVLRYAERAQAGLPLFEPYQASNAPIPDTLRPR